MNCSKCDAELVRDQRHLYDVFAGSAAELYDAAGQPTYLFSFDVEELYRLLQQWRGTEDAPLIEWTEKTGGRRIVPRHVNHLPSHVRDLPGLAVVVPVWRNGNLADSVRVLVDGNHRLARARHERRPFHVHVLSSQVAQRAVVYDTVRP